MESKRKLLCVLSLIIPFSLVIQKYQAVAQTNIPSGYVGGIWTLANSPYRINGEITVPNGDTLIVEPGVQIIFTGHFKFNVQGRLLATGTINDSIVFTAQDTMVGWHGIRFISTPSSNDSSKIIYCSLKYGKANTGDVYDRCGGAVLVKSFSKLLISNCLISSNMNSGDLSNNAGGAIGILSCSPVIENNIISDNRAVGNHGGGIAIAWGSNPLIRNNIICRNHAAGGGGLYVYQSNPVFINNTIVSNQADLPGNQVCHGGAACIGDCSPEFINTILFGNTATVGNQFNLQDASQPNFYFCDIEGGKESFARNMVNGSGYSGVYESNKESDPLFIAMTGDDFHLSDASPCISAGADSVNIGSKEYVAPQSDCEGNPRPNPAGTLPDIGALENSKGHQTGIRKMEVLPTENMQLYQNYPNPCSSVTTIKYSIPCQQMVTLKIIDLLGRDVAELVNEVKQPGNYYVDFRTGTLPDGTYYYRLISGVNIQTRKCIVIK